MQTYTLALGKTSQGGTGADHGRQPFRQLPGAVRTAAQLADTDDDGLDDLALCRDLKEAFSNPLGFRVPSTDSDACRNRHLLGVRGFLVVCLG